MRSIYSVILFSLLSGIAGAAELVPDKNSRLLFVNGSEIESTSAPAPIKEGYTQAVVRVSATLGRGNNKRVFDSAPFLLTFTTGNEDISIVSPKLRSYEQANQHFKKKPDIKLYSNDREVEYTYTKLEGEPGFMPYYNLDRILAEYNDSNNIHFTATGELLTSSTVVAVASSSMSNEIETASKSVTPSAQKDMKSISNLDQLKAWYLKASKEERKEFRRWMIDQE